MSGDTFDFGDDHEFVDRPNFAGPVPAHRHANGGGWVADTATVDPTAYVGPSAQVSGHAQVSIGSRFGIMERHELDQIMTKCEVQGQAGGQSDESMAEVMRWASREEWRRVLVTMKNGPRLSGRPSSRGCRLGPDWRIEQDDGSAYFVSIGAGSFARVAGVVARANVVARDILEEAAARVRVLDPSRALRPAHSPWSNECGTEGHPPESAHTSQPELPACEHCNDTGHVAYETETEDLDALCHRCYRAPEPTPQIEVWALVDRGVSERSERVHYWAAVRGDETKPFRTAWDHRRTTYALGLAGHGAGLVSVPGEHCHQMCAARAIEALNVK